jgi:hypothetical protein
VVAALEKGFEIFTIVKEKGIGGLWEFVKDKLSSLKDTVIEGIKEMVITQVIKAGITWLIGILGGPAGAFIKAAKAIYDIVMWFINNAAQLASLIQAIVGAVSAIASGSLGAAAKYIEDTLARFIPMVIGFLASLLGLGNLGQKIRGIIQKVQEPINKAIDWVLQKAKAAVRKIGGMLGLGKKDERGPDPRTPQEKQADLDKAVAESQQEMKRQGATPASVQEALPAIKAKYGLVSLVLVKGKEDNYHVEAEINPKRKSEAIELKTGREVLSAETKKQAFEELAKIREPADVNPALVEVASKGKEGAAILERYKEEYKGYLNGLSMGSDFDWPLSYLRRRASCKRGKIVQRNWAQHVYGGAGGKSYKVKQADGSLHVRIPDYVSGSVVADVKDVKNQSYDAELRDFHKIAKPGNYPGEVFELDGVTPLTKDRSFELIVRDPEKHSEGGTNVSGPLKAVLDALYEVIHDQPEGEGVC